jgi:hypothetical protein
MSSEFLWGNLLESILLGDHEGDWRITVKYAMCGKLMEINQLCCYG